jgi:hypothetical protein
VRPKLLYCFTAITGFSDENHVRLATDDRCDPFAQ